MAHSDLLRKFTDIAFDDSTTTRWQEAQRAKAEEIDLEPMMEAQSQKELFESAKSLLL